MSDTRILVARRLLAAGAGRSARSILGTLRGAEANRLRKAARTVRLRPGIYALAVHQDSGALIVPMEAELGVRASRSPELGRTLQQVERQLNRLLRQRQLPSLRLQLDHWLMPFGESLGLPAALALLAHLLPSSRGPRFPVLATGTLEPDGSIGEVSHLVLKLEAAAGELAGGEGLVLGPSGAAGRARTVTSIDEACEVVFGADPLILDPQHAGVERVLQVAQQEPGHSRALEMLGALDPSSVRPADRCRVALERSMRLRHLGRADEARSELARIRDDAATAARVLGIEATERLELEEWLIRIDEFELAPVIEGLTERLRRPFVLLRNELRCRGMLAQALAMAGRYAEALAIRRENLALHETEDWLRQVLPGTYCYLTLDSALAGDPASFEHYAFELIRATAPGDAHQWRYNAAVIARGLTVLDRDEALLHWLRSGSTFLGVEAPRDLVRLAMGSARIEEHPEVSTARALCRAFWRTDHTAEAIALAGRVRRTCPPASGSDLLAWLQQLCQLEAVLALRRAGSETDARTLLAAARERLPQLHPRATAAHPLLLTAEPEQLSDAIDGVWY